MTPAPGLRTSAGGLAVVAALSACSPGADPPSPADQSFVLDGVSGLTQVAQLTGVDSVNATDQYGVYGTDLGSMINAGDTTYFLFGDTFGERAPDHVGAGGAYWRSNVLAHSTDTDPADGITFDGMTVDESGLATELVPGLHEPDGTGEVTKIPTYGFAAGGSLYLHFMSVHHWGAPGEWDANYAGLARSDDDGRTWSVLDDVRWPGASNFVQVSAFVSESHNSDEDVVYLWGIPGGRFGSVQLASVPVGDVDDPGAYRYFTGLDDAGQPSWDADPAAATTVVDDTVGELSVVHNPYLDRWIMTYLKEGTGVVLREGLTPWGPWDDPHVVVPAEDHPGLYAPYLNPRYTSDGGRTIYFTLSLWDPYNVFLFKADLDKAG